MDPCFQRGLPGKWKLSEGIPGEIINFLRKAKAEACYKIKFLDAEYHHVVFEVDEGNVVLDSFDIDEEIWRTYKLEIKALNGFVTIVDQLKPEVIYQRIKLHYEAILDNCLGKSVEEQMKYLGMIDTPNLKYKLDPKQIENSKDLIRNLPSELIDDEQIKKFIRDILSSKGNDSVEYGNHSKDKYSVEMHQYAKALAKKLQY